MPSFARALSLLPAEDWLALVLFVAAWVVYATFAKRRGASDDHASLLGATNRHRREWMLRATYRDNRIVDAAVLQSLSASASFFASTTILIIGGLMAVIGTTDKASELVREIPFAARTSALVFDLKVALLLAIFVFAFFRFTWSIRQYSFASILVGAAPDAAGYAEREPAEREAFADRAGRVVAYAAEAFNDGLRTYYMAFAALGWFFSAWAFIGATAFVVTVLYMREFHSDVLQALR